MIELFGLFYLLGFLNSFVSLFCKRLASYPNTMTPSDMKCLTYDHLNLTLEWERLRKIRKMYGVYLPMTLKSCISGAALTPL